MALPNSALLDLLEEAFQPCAQFSQSCTSRIWDPARGHVPRGFLGATGSLSEVELVLVVAEPGDPQPEETYEDASSPRELLKSTCQYVYRSHRDGEDLFHRNLRQLLDRCYPKLDFDSQLRRTWITESILCSAEEEGRYVPAEVCRACGERYLERQLDLFSEPVVAALGSKSQERLRKYVPGIEPEGFISAYSVAPPGCNFDGAEESWKEVARRVRESSE